MKTFINKILRKMNVCLSYKGNKWKVNELSDFHGRKILKNGVGYNKKIISKWNFDHVLDLGCNKGFFPLWLRSLGLSFTYLGIDASLEAIKRANLNILINNINGARFINTVIGPSNSVLKENTKHSPESKAEIFCVCAGVANTGIKKIARADTRGQRSLLKMDIEGAEYYLFNEEKDLQYFDLYEYIIVEYHKPLVNLTFIREKLANHQLIYAEEHSNVGHAYFQKFNKIID